MRHIVNKINKEDWKIYFKRKNKIFPWLVSNDGGNTGHQFCYEKSATDFCNKMNEADQDNFGKVIFY